MDDKEFEVLDKSDSKLNEITLKLKQFDIDVKRVLKINVLHLKESFDAELSKLKQLRPKGFNENILSLYHGSHAKWRHLAFEGLDERLSRKGRFGRGIYFSDDPQKCFKYANKDDDNAENQFILLCNVILGDIKEYEKGEEARDLKKEPIKDVVNGRVIYYDSVKGQPKDFTEYVVYDKRRVLIKYIIFYSHFSGIEKEKIKSNTSNIDANDSDSGDLSDCSSNESNNLMDEIGSKSSVNQSSKKISKVENEVMIQQKNLALMQLFELKSKISSKDFEELMYAFVQTYGPDETLNRFYPEIVSTFGLIQTFKNSESDGNKEQIQKFKEVTGCHDEEKCEKYLKDSGMDVNIAVSKYFDK